MNKMNRNTIFEKAQQKCEIFRFLEAARKAGDLLSAQISNWPYGLVGKAPV